MGWSEKENVAGARVSTSKECFMSVVRDEYIPVGYTITETVTEGGVEKKVTRFVQSGSVNIRCKVKTTVVTVEERGLDKTRAEEHGWFNDVADNRDVATWTSGSISVSVPNCVGTIIRVNARRANEADGWVVTKTTTTTVKV